ncbi:hypothetical protein K488DRAFT_40369 [Vararia minispora EC-137]|uniref:Uncharacterized protein n=1 Tax=Vararia minispora EC-137 TaxID=1314806 RepID=A0ACB8QYP3_9AGAM|nr:hypothetical protein K488DRAFT_40369 [Vararia minispora EC-137]
MAGASAADIRGILSLPENAAPGPSQMRKPPTKKPEGIPRELYALIGPSAPTMIAQPAKPRFKQKPNLGGGGSVRWEERPFKNPARTDGLVLKHWVKASVDPNEDYPFVKYNVKGPIYNYTSEEYVRLLEDSSWTKEETDYLFSLVKEFDSRFYVVSDRYDFPGGRPRSMEWHCQDLKDRYYSVCRKLVRSRPWSGDDASKAQLLSSLQFDKDREVTRKKYLDSLENRTPEETAEEEALYIELKRLEQTERRFKLEREELLRTLLGVESGLPGLPFEEEGPLGDPRKRKRIMEHDSATPPSASTPIQPRRVLPQMPQQSASSAQYDQLHCIFRPDPRMIVPSKSAHNIAYLRSGKMPYPKQSVAAKVTQVLTELDVQQTRLVMPTRENLLAYESLIEAATQLVEAKKVSDRLDQDIRVAKQRLGLRESAGETQERGEGSTQETVPMEQDEEDGGGQDGQRAGSVASSRSVKSRRTSQRRSLSVSSVDTMGAGRAQKRQKLS